MSELLYDYYAPMKESQLVQEYLWKYHRLDPQWTRVRLGVLPTHKMGREYMTLLRWADAIVLHDGKVLIIEAKLRAKFDGIGQLLGYDMLFPYTPQFQKYIKWPRELIYLNAMFDTATAELAAKYGIKYVVYDPRSGEEKSIYRQP